MDKQYTVALVLDPEFGDRLSNLAEKKHVWAVGTPTNRKVADKIWNTMPEHNIESGITTFDTTLGVGPEEWCISILGTIDQHHDEMSHDPGYSVLEVYGLEFINRLEPSFKELGFTIFEKTNYGFRALKALTLKST